MRAWPTPEALLRPASRPDALAGPHQFSIQHAARTAPCGAYDLGRARTRHCQSLARLRLAVGGVAAARRLTRACDEQPILAPLEPAGRACPLSVPHEAPIRHRD